MKKLILISLTIIINNLTGYSQETSFNEESGFLLNTQFMGLIDYPRFSPIIGYKQGGITYLVGYDQIHYNTWSPHGFKCGIHLYPHKNLKKIKVFYQSLISYKWDLKDDYPRMYLLNLGSGIDYFFRKNFSVGYDFSLGAGRMKDTENTDYGMVFSYSSMISIKYFIYRK